MTPIPDELEPSTTCLLFFDTSKIFVDGPTLDPSALSPDERRPDVTLAVANWSKQLERARALGMMVAYAHTAQRADGANYFARRVDLDRSLETAPDGHRPMSKAIIGTAAVDPIDELAPLPGEYIFWKERWDPWHQTSFEMSLRLRGIDTIIVNGGATEIGIAATAYGAQRLDFHTVFVSDGCVTKFADCQEVFMSSILPRIGRVRTTEEVLALLPDP